MNRNSALAVSAIAALAAGQALAHHSYAMFDQNKTLRLSGTVKELEWVAPHAWLYIVAANQKGVQDEFAFEMGAPVQIARGGWRRDTVKAGDKVTVEYHPLKDGTNGGQFLLAIVPDGRTLGQVGGMSFNSRPAPGGDEETLKQGERGQR